MNAHSDSISMQASAIPTAERRDVTDDPNDVHTDAGTLTTMIRHVHWLTLDITFGKAPDAEKLMVIQGILAMASVWAERLDTRIGDAVSNELQRQAARRRQAKAVTA